MTIGKGEKISATDINALIDDVKTESTRRGDGWAGEPGDVSRADKLTPVPSDAMYDQLVVINALHCYCEAFGGYDAHLGGVPISLTSNPVGPLSKNVDRQINDDIVSLAAQCNCDSDACSCAAFQNCPLNCTCNTNCGCNKDCTCDDVCSCDTNCTCDAHWFDMCGDDWWVCMCDTNCPCDSYFVCTCETNCTCFYNCTCDDYCVCNSDCSCDNQCNCEFGG